MRIPTQRLTFVHVIIKMIKKDVLSKDFHLQVPQSNSGLETAVKIIDNKIKVNNQLA